MQHNCSSLQTILLPTIAQLTFPATQLLFTFLSPLFTIFLFSLPLYSFHTWLHPTFFGLSLSPSLFLLFLPLLFNLFLVHLSAFCGLHFLLQAFSVQLFCCAVLSVPYHLSINQFGGKLSQFCALNSAILVRKSKAPCTVQLIQSELKNTTFRWLFASFTQRHNGTTESA